MVLIFLIRGTELDAFLVLALARPTLLYFYDLVPWLDKVAFYLQSFPMNILFEFAA